MVAVIDVLKRYAKQQASKDAVMRALAEHDDWFIPVGLLPDHTKFEQVVALASEGPPSDRLWLFSDDDRARAASGGVYGGGLPATQVFELLDDRFSALEINPGSPADETWNIGREAFPLAKGWAQAVALERAFHGDPAELAQRLARYDHFMVLVADDNSLIKLPLGPDDDPFGLAFTTPDWREDCLAKMSAEERARVRSVAVRGKDLFGRLEQLGVRGLILNATAPERARVVVPLEVARLVPAP